MPQHSHHDHSADAPDHDNEAGLADLLDLDAEVLGYLDEVIEWVGQHAPEAPRRIVDVGAGTGIAGLALARRFGMAEGVAIDASPLMLERIRGAAREQALTERIRVEQADLDIAWPEIGAVDVAWVSSSLHHIADPDRLLDYIYAAMNPGGLLVVIEIDALPRFLPDDIGFGRPGLETRCHEAMAQADWNSHPDWRPHIERAGFEVVEQRSFDIEARPEPSIAGRYARAFLRRVRSSLESELDSDDLRALDHLLADDNLDSLLRRGDLVVRGSRTGWLARRP